MCVYYYHCNEVICLDPLGGSWSSAAIRQVTVPGVSIAESQQVTVIYWIEPHRSERIKPVEGQLLSIQS